jgi:hypothetical protein
MRPYYWEENTKQKIHRLLHIVIFSIPLQSRILLKKKVSSSNAKREVSLNHLIQNSTYRKNKIKTTFSLLQMQSLKYSVYLMDMGNTGILCLVSLPELCWIILEIRNLTCVQNSYLKMVSL